MKRSRQRRFDAQRRFCAGSALCAALLVQPAAQAAQTAPSSPGWFEIPVPTERPEATPQNIAEGKRLYDFRCSPCHGVRGDAQGPVAPFLDPRPRDFTQANFKFRTTSFGELPRDDDLYRTITRGIPDTAMPSWAPLTPDERFQLIYYIKTFSDFFEDPAFDFTRVEDGETFIIEVPDPPEPTPEFLEQSVEVFKRARCAECHGEIGRGNGSSAGTQFTYLKHRILPRDLTKGWNFKGGSGLEDIFRTLTAGLNGTPMPSFIASLDEDHPVQDVTDRWAAAYYVRSIAQTEDHSEETLLEVRRVDGTLPTDPDDEAWDAAHEIHFRLLGQVTRRPRWQTPAINHVRVRALYNEAEIAFRLEYHDRTESTEHADPDILSEETTYPLLDVSEYAWKTTRFADAVALQFPAKKQVRSERPYFIYGQLANPVVLWRFRADRPQAAPVEQLVAKGPEKIKPDPEASEQLSGSARYDDGRWRVVMRRALTTEPGKKDVQFEPGEYIPFVVMGWDGGNGESGLRQSISSWYNLKLEAPVPARTYLYALVALALTAALEWSLFTKARRSRAVRVAAGPTAAAARPSAGEPLGGEAP